MDHFKYLGKFKPESNKIIITDTFMDKPDIIIVKVPKREWRVIAALNTDQSNAMIAIHNDDFQQSDVKKCIGNTFFRTSAIFSDKKFFDNGDLRNLYDKNLEDHNYDSTYDIGNRFAYVYSPGGWCEGYIYEYRNEDSNEITSLEINFTNVETDD
jgi:hypothetical protein